MIFHNSKGQEKQIIQQIERLEKNTGFKLRIVCQRYESNAFLRLIVFTISS